MIICEYVFLNHIILSRIAILTYSEAWFYQEFV